MRQIHRRGYRAASLADILAETGLTRGALYHHFPNKKALGLAVLDAIGEQMERMWLQPLEDSPDPLRALQGALAAVKADLDEEDIEFGCPLNNLAQEMSPMDQAFRAKVANIYYQWRAGVARALERGQKAGNVRPEADPESAAAFFTAALTGGRGLAKAARRREALAMVDKELHAWLESLRPPAPA